MTQTIIDLLKNGAKANYTDKFRQGNLICLPADGELIATGDIHGHQRNFERIVTFADLANNPERHIILQEIIHGGRHDSKGCCQSYKILFECIRYKLSFPDRVHIIIGNHDTTFINDRKILKDGKEINRSFRLALDREFKQESDDIKLALKEYLFSQPLAVRCPNRIWLSHSLPGNRYVDQFDRAIFDNQIETHHLVKPGSAYLLTWGRNHSQPTLDKMADLLDVDIFILGHQTQTQGWSRAGKNLIIINSDHNHGCLLPFNLAKSYTIEELIDSIVPLASIP